ncbi:winged helix-turn-helix domain-containing protein [Dermacoccaceae bacterium W4C1]
MRVLLVELGTTTHPRLAEALGAHLDTVETVDRTTTAIWICQRSEPAVAVVCVDAAGEAEVRAATRLRDAGSPTPVLVVADRAEPEDVVRALDAGADDYVARPVRLAEICARVRALSRRPVAAIEHVLEADEIALAQDTGEVHRCGQIIHLSPIQTAVLGELLRRPGRVVSRAELLESAWDPAAENSSNVVDQVIAELRRRLDTPFGRSDLQTVRGRGYRWHAQAWELPHRISTAAPRPRAG